MHELLAGLTREDLQTEVDEWSSIDEAARQNGIVRELLRARCRTLGVSATRNSELEENSLDDASARWKGQQKANPSQYDMAMTLVIEAESDAEAWVKAIAFEKIREYFHEPVFEKLGVQWMHVGLSSDAVVYTTGSET